MKTLLILTAAIALTGLTLPATASPYRETQTTTTIFISGYLHGGTPIYSKRVKKGQRSYTQRLSSYELQRYLERQRKATRLHNQRTRSQSHRNRYTTRR